MSSIAPAHAEALTGAWGNKLRSELGVTVWMAVAAFTARAGAMILFRTYEFGRLPASYPASATFPFGMETGSIAASIATGHGFSSPFGGQTGPTTWIGPVYPYLLAAIFKVFGLFTTGAAIAALSMNIVFAALTCIPLFLLAERTFGRRNALWTGWIWALCPIFFRWPITWVWEVSLSALLSTILLLLCVLWAESRRASRDASIFGAIAGISILVNPALLIVTGLCALWASWQRHREKLAVGKPILLMAVVCGAVLLPWLIRNWMVFGKPVFVRGNFWVEFSLGNYSASNGMGWQGKHPTVNVAEYNSYKQMGEQAYIATKEIASKEFLRDHPGEFITLTLRRILVFWDGEAFLYQPQDALIPLEARLFPWFSAFSILGLGLAARCGKRPSLLFFAVAVFYPAAYYITFSQPRYRHAMEPMLLIAIVYLFREVQRVLPGKPRRQPANP